jgi:hypothetical protein
MPEVSEARSSQASTSFEDTSRAIRCPLPPVSSNDVIVRATVASIMAAPAVCRPPSTRYDRAEDDRFRHCLRRLPRAAAQKIGDAVFDLRLAGPGVTLVKASIEDRLDRRETPGFGIDRQPQSSRGGVDGCEVRYGQHHPWIVPKTCRRVRPPDRQHLARKPSVEAVLGQPHYDVALGLTVAPRFDEGFRPLNAE